MGKPGDKMRKGQREGERRWETGRGLGISKECRGRKGEVWEFGKFFRPRLRAGAVASRCGQPAPPADLPIANAPHVINDHFRYIHAAMHPRCAEWHLKLQTPTVYIYAKVMESLIAFVRATTTTSPPTVLPELRYREREVANHRYPCFQNSAIVMGELRCASV